MKQRKAFTMIELIVVVSIIAVLTVTAIVSYLSAQSNSRDSRRRADVQAIASAFQIVYQDKKAWNLDYSGSGGGGEGWFNYDYDLGGTNISIAKALENGKYLISAPRDPQITSDTDLGHNDKSVPKQYMKYNCPPVDNEVTIYAKLESPSAEEVNQVMDGCGYLDGVGPSGFDMNFSVTVGQ